MCHLIIQLMIKGILGRGAWGVVYRGIWRNMDVAIKTVGAVHAHHSCIFFQFFWF